MHTQSESDDARWCCWCIFIKLMAFPCYPITHTCTSALDWIFTAAWCMCMKKYTGIICRVRTEGVPRAGAAAADLFLYWAHQLVLFVNNTHTHTLAFLCRVRGGICLNESYYRTEREVCAAAVNFTLFAAHNRRAAICCARQPDESWIVKWQWTTICLQLNSVSLVMWVYTYISEWSMYLQNFC